MGYRFTGFIVSQAEVLDEARSRWPRCNAEINQGIAKAVVSCPDPAQADSDEECESLVELGYEVEDGVIPISQTYPEAFFVFLRADCAGGRCHYRGWVSRDGQILENEEGYRGDGALTKLVRHLGINLGPDERFALFER